MPQFEKMYTFTLPVIITVDAPSREEADEELTKMCEVLFDVLKETAGVHDDTCPIEVDAHDTYALAEPKR